jgi:hypothetical protein
VWKPGSEFGHSSPPIFYVSEGSALDDAASLLDAGIIDSTGVLEVIMFLEHRLG